MLDQPQRQCRDVWWPACQWSSPRQPRAFLPCTPRQRETPSARRRQRARRRAVAGDKGFRHWGFPRRGCRELRVSPRVAYDATNWSEPHTALLPGG
jgi:hypothetical protein